MFRAFLIRDLTAYLKPIHGDKLALDYELLLRWPDSERSRHPKYYLWLNATNDAGMVMEVARVAAVDQKGFRVTDFCFTFRCDFSSGIAHRIFHRR